MTKLSGSAHGCPNFHNLYFSVGSADVEVKGKSKEMGIMFLNEVVLGKEKHVLDEQFNLKAAPPGYDSVIAVGENEPGE